MGSLRRGRYECFGLVLAFFAGPAAQAQASLALPRDESSALTSPSTYQQMASTEQIFREFEDSTNGIRWLLLRDDDHPGGPGRLVPVASLKSVEARPFSGNRAQVSAKKLVPVLPPPVVRAGDRLIVEEHTPIVDVRLEAVALSSAAAGAFLNVRLKIGGKVVRAKAMEPGRATLQSGSEARP